ncbi:MAG: hypothetical protein PHH01_03645, partial [Patescibacteria group bacterium]|nr:hypothetical protein [Patescibacteria group bacterium]
MIFDIFATLPATVNAATPEPETVSDLFILLAMIFGAVAVIVIAFFIIRKVLISANRLPAAFQRVVLMVTVPKEHLELDQKSEKPQGGIKELMAVAEYLYSNFGGIVRQQRFYSRLLFGRQDHIAVEIVAVQGVITFYFAVPRKYQQFVEQLIHAQYPDAEIEEVEDYNIFSPQGVIRCNYLKLTKPNMFPIRTYLKMETDPMFAVTNVLSKIQAPEGAAIQILIRPAAKNWQSSAQEYCRRIIKGRGKAGGVGGAMGGVMQSAFSSKVDAQKSFDRERMYRMSPMEEEKVKAVGEKANKLGFETNIRVIVSAQDDSRAQLFMENIINTFSQYSLPEAGNRFRRVKVLRKSRFIKDSIYRYFR